jgi:hypothetical protein
MFIRVTAKGFPGRVCINTDFISYIVPLNPTDWDSQSGWAYDINVYALDGKNRSEFFRIKEDDAERIFKLIGVSEEVEASASNASTSDSSIANTASASTSDSSIANAASTSTARDRASFDSSTIKSTTPASKNDIDQKSRLEMLKKIASSRKIK